MPNIDEYEEHNPNRFTETGDKDARDEPNVSNAGVPNEKNDTPASKCRANTPVYTHLPGYAPFMFWLLGYIGCFVHLFVGILGILSLGLFPAVDVYCDYLGWVIEMKFKVACYTNDTFRGNL